MVIQSHVDIKSREYWFQEFEDVENHFSTDSNIENCRKVTKEVDYVFNMACNMGGIVENNKVECAQSSL